MEKKCGEGRKGREESQDFKKSEAGVGSAGHWNFIKIINRRWECRPLEFLKIQKLALGVPAIEIF